MELLQKHFDIALETPDGIKKLRGLVLTLAMQGKLVPHDKHDQPASDLLRSIEAEKARLVKSGKNKRQEPLAKIGSEEIPHVLPTSWEWVRIGTIAEHDSGKTLDSGRNSGKLKEYITTSNLYWGFFLLENLRKMPFQPTEIERFTATKGDLLLCEGGEAGRAAVWKEDFDICFQNHIHRVRFFSEIDPYFGFRFFQKLDYSGEINSYRKGVGISSMSGKTLSSIVFPLPPLNEQKRILAKIDQLMELCDKLEAERNIREQKRVAVHTAAMNRLLSASDKFGFDNSWQFITKHFNELYSVAPTVAELRKAILQLAVMGKLVPQVPSDQPACELLKDIEAEKARLVAEGRIKKQAPLTAIKIDAMPYALPQGWAWVRLGHLTESITYGTSQKCTYDAAKNSKVLRIPNVSSGMINDSDLKFTSLSKKEMHYLALKYGDILTIRSNGSPEIVGTMAFVTQAFENYCFAGYLIRLRFQFPLIGQFLSKISRATSIRSQIEDPLRTTVGINNINTQEISNLRIALPPLAEQKRIIAKIDQLMALCDELEKQIGAATDKKTAILNAVLAEIAIPATVGSEATQSQQMLFERPSHEIYDTLGLDSSDLHAGILALVIAEHDRNPQFKNTLGRTKGEKICHIVESHLQLELGRTPTKMAAGPADFQHILQVERHAQQQKWFLTEARDISSSGYLYTKRENFGAITTKVESALGDRLLDVKRIIALFVPMTTVYSEIAATTYAAWNNLIRLNKEPSENEILFEARENWKKEKLALDAADFRNCIRWLKANNLAPTGKGKVVT